MNKLYFNLILILVVSLFLVLMGFVEIKKDIIKLNKKVLKIEEVIMLNGLFIAEE